MESITEFQRRFLEERERLEEQASKMLANPTKNPLDVLSTEHTAAELLSRIQRRAQQTNDLFRDDDQTRQSEMDRMTGPGVFTEFYDRLRDIKDWHRRNPGEIGYDPVDGEVKKLKEATAAQVQAQFTDEEGLGKYLDLHPLHETFVNLRNATHVDYLTYLREVDAFDRLSPALRSSTAYRDYLFQLKDHLAKYHQRCHPLDDINQHIAAVAETARNQFDASASTSSLFCTACDKLFAKQSVYDAHLPGKKHLKAVERLKTAGTAEAAVSSGPTGAALLRDIAEAEATVVELMKRFDARRQATLVNVERKQARTAEELEEEAEEEMDIDVFEEEEESDEEERPLYNPKNLPLGFDGKPIPYWLYKLHGLNFEFKCAICGDATYRGPKVFQQHFGQWKHSQGLRAYGIPNTSHFYGITEIADAIALYEKVKNEKVSEAWRAEVSEEFEDSMGNIISKKMYEDLKRQGLL